jgi:hypothetical protein
MSSWKVSVERPTGFQRHHVIPVNVMRRRSFAKLFDLIATAGFDPNCFLNNGFLLPATEEKSAETGLPLHRGPHRQYDDLISECLNMIWLEVLTNRVPANPVAIMTRVSDLQGQIRRSLGPNAQIRLNQHDPRHVERQSSLLDANIRQIDWDLLLAE